MPSLDTHHSSGCTKTLYIGDSGTGKTGSLASLVKAGYRLFIADMDNGLDILANLLRREPNGKELLSRVHFKTMTDPMRASGINVIPSQATAWRDLVALLNKWPDEGLGSLTTWGPQDVFVLDTLNFAGKACVRFVLSLNARVGQQPTWSDYYTAQQMLENMCAMLYSDSIKCNVIVMSHVREIGKKEDHINPDGKAIKVEVEGTRRGYAETGAGVALSPNMGRYFNGVLLADKVGTGRSTRHIIRTMSHENIGLKNPNPGVVLPEYPLETGLADYFKSVRGPVKIAAPAAASTPAPVGAP